MEYIIISVLYCNHGGKKMSEEYKLDSPYCLSCHSQFLRPWTKQAQRVWARKVPIVSIIIVIVIIKMISICFNLLHARLYITYLTCISHFNNNTMRQIGSIFLWKKWRLKTWKWERYDIMKTNEIWHQIGSISTHDLPSTMWSCENYFTSLCFRFLNRNIRLLLLSYSEDAFRSSPNIVPKT